MGDQRSGPAAPAVGVGPGSTYPDLQAQPVARSPIPPASPVTTVGGWEVSGRVTNAPLRLADCTALAKVLVRARAGGPVEHGLGVPFRQCRRDEDGSLVIGSGPGEWLVLAAPGDARKTIGRLAWLAELEFTSVVDLTHGRALVRLTGADAARMLAKVCAIDLSDRVTPSGTAFRSSVAKVATDVARDDDAAGPDGGPVPSYLLHCERSSGRYLWEALLDTGSEFGIEPEGFSERTI